MSRRSEENPTQIPAPGPQPWRAPRLWWAQVACWLQVVHGCGEIAWAATVHQVRPVVPGRGHGSPMHVDSIFPWVSSCGTFAPCPIVSWVQACPPVIRAPLSPRSIATGSKGRKTGYLFIWPHTGPSHQTPIRRHVRDLSIMRRQVASSLLRCASAAGVGTKPAVPCLATSTRLFADDASLKKTPLYDFHVEHGGAYGGPGVVL